VKKKSLVLVLMVFYLAATGCASTREGTTSDIQMVKVSSASVENPAAVPDADVGQADMEDEQGSFDSEEPDQTELESKNVVERFCSWILYPVIPFFMGWFLQ